MCWSKRKRAASLQPFSYLARQSGRIWELDYNSSNLTLVRKTLRMWAIQSEIIDSQSLLCLQKIAIF
jgi:hypothetical protein